MKKLFKMLIFVLLPLSFSMASCNSGTTVDTSTYTIALKESGTTINLEIDETYLLTPVAFNKEGTALTDKTFRFNSSNPSVASINNDGMIFALKPGNATITVISDTQINKCYVCVGGEQEELLALSFNPDTVTIKLGGTYTPNLVTYPEGITGIQYHWYSNDENIAIVEDEKIIGKAVGSTVIKAVYGQIEASLNVTVSDTGGAFSMTLNRDNISLKEGNTFQLVATCSEEATITWSSDNSGVASVDKDGLVSANKKGSTVVRASANGVTVSCSVVVSDGSLPEETNLKVYFYIDYNNIDTPYVYEKGFDWYTGVPLGLENMPAAPSVAPDPAFPNFIGWSDHTIIDDTKDLWDFENDVVPEGTYTYVLYGIWFD